MGSGSTWEEHMPRGHPDHRPAKGGCILSRTPGMQALSEEFGEHALMATVMGERPKVSPADLVSALRSKFGIRRKEVQVEVYAPPYDFFIRFVSSSDRSRVLESSRSFEIFGEKMSFIHWHRGCGHALLGQ